MNQPSLPFKVIVYTNSRYVDVLTVFLRQILANCAFRFHLVLITDDVAVARRLVSGFIELGDILADLSFSKYSDSEPFSFHIAKCLIRYTRPGENILFLQDDFFVVDDLDCDRLAYLSGMLKRSHASFVRLLPSGVAPKTGTSEPAIVDISTEKYILVDAFASYPYSMQATIWKSSDLLRIMMSAKCERIWDEQHPSYSSAYSSMGLFGLAALEMEIKYIATGVIKGKWNFLKQCEWKQKIAGLEDVPALLLKNGIDYSLRGAICD